MSKIVMAVRQLNPEQEQVFGIFGDKNSLETCLCSLFSNNHTQIKSIFTELDLMPAIWVVYDTMKFVFVLVSTDDVTSEKHNYFMVVMQRFLQDLCQNIIICSSDAFFSDFSTQHSFHGKPHETRTYRQVKKEQHDIPPPQKMKLDDKDIFKTLLVEQHRKILITNNTPNIYCYEKLFQGPNQTLTTNRYDKLKESLATVLHINTLTLRPILHCCSQYGIFLSTNQESQIQKLLEEHTTKYKKEKLNIHEQAKALVKKLFGIENTVTTFFTIGTSIDQNLRHQLYNETTEWLVIPKYINESADQFYNRFISTFHRHILKNYNIDVKRMNDFKSALQRIDKKKIMLKLQESLVNHIYVTVQSEIQHEVHYNILPLSYTLLNDTDNSLHYFTATRSTSICISLNDLGQFINISDLSEIDRSTFANQTELIGCFKMNDGKTEIIVIKRPTIVSKKLGAPGYTVVLHKNKIFRKLTDFCLSNVRLVYSSNSSTHTLVLYNIDNGSVTLCLLDNFGHIQHTSLLSLQDRAKKPIGVKSLTLTVAQNLLILIDSNSKVYELNISEDNYVNISQLSKSRNNSQDTSNFIADNGDLYQEVQTIGEKNPVFLFQAKSSIDIINQNYCQIYSIILEHQPSVYGMQIFTDFIDTYCAVFSAHFSEVYCIQNLISDTRIERQLSLNNLEKSPKQYIGNRLFDIIKRGELQFGVPDSLDETQYYLNLPSEYNKYSDRIKKYFKDLNMKAHLKLGYTDTDFISQSLDIHLLITNIVSRIPLQLCTIEMGTLVPLNNGRRDKMDHLSSKSFGIEMKAREILLSYLDNILNNINDDIKIVGIIGRQSTGKSYLMNKIFRTRFAVAAGRCTDGIWMSYAYIENTHFIILDCEGLFSDQRTEDEEIKLISFLSALCDITILSQDLGFSRFQDRLFGILSQAVDKIGINDKLFKGILLVAIRDISDNNADESINAAEKKFSDLQRKGKSGFLEQLFSNTFKIQLLHHFENKNFDHEIDKLRHIFIKHVIKDEITGLKIACRWENGKDLADRLKILLIQLYTDDFIDSNKIHCDMKFAELEDEMRKAWTKFHLSNEESIVLKEQLIEKKIEDTLYSLKLNHTLLQFDENSADNNFENICEFILVPLRSITTLSNDTNEDNNKLFSIINELIDEVMSFRRQQVKELMSERFQKKIPSENDDIKERKTKFVNSMEQYMLSFKLQICLKKCSLCDLKCIHNAQHTEEAKSLLEKKKDQLVQLQVSLKPTMSKNVEERIKYLNEKVLTAKEEENQLHKEKIYLLSELKYLSDKENLETNITQCNSEVDTEKSKIDNFTQTMNDINNQLKTILLLDDDFIYSDQLLHKLNEDIELLVNPDQYKINDINILIANFHQNYETDCTDKDNLWYSFEEKETTEEKKRIDEKEAIKSFDDSHVNTLLPLKMIPDIVDAIRIYRRFVQEHLEKIKKELDINKQRLSNNEIQIKNTEQKIIDARKENEDIEKTIEILKIECKNLNEQLSDITFKREALSKELEEENTLINTKTSSEVQKLEHYMKDLQEKLNAYDSSTLNADQMELEKRQEIKKLEFFLKEKSGKESKLAAYKMNINSMDENTQITERMSKDEQAIAVISEKINNVRIKIKFIEEQLILSDQQDKKQQLNEELKEINQLVDTIRLYDQKIELANTELCKTLSIKKMKEKYIKFLKADEDAEGIEDEESHLININKTIDNTQMLLNNIKQERQHTCDNNHLLVKIMNILQCDIDKQQKNKQNHLAELLEQSRQLNDKIEKLQNSLCVEENKLKNQNQEMLDISEVFALEQEEYEEFINNVKSNSNLNDIGTELFQLLSETETLLITTSGKLARATKAKHLIQEYMTLSGKLKFATQEQNRLDALHNDLIQQLNTMKSNNFTCRYEKSRTCKERYDLITKEYDNAQVKSNKLEKELADMDIYSRLKNEITNLEKEAQGHCSCETDHKCSGICRICSEEDQNKQNKCMFLAGHDGDHKCDAGHVCTQFCQMCEIYGFQNNRCVFAYEHMEPKYHQCERIHQCPATCVCSDPCAISLGLQKHEEHRCNKSDCWKPCIFSCGNLCVANDHNHDVTAEIISISIDNDNLQMKKHLCNQSHYCKGICSALGVCKQEYKTQQRKWTTESGIEFSYEHIEVEEVRAKCGIKIGVGKTSHDASSPHLCDSQHTCPERCPDCGSFCRDPIHHDGNHRTIHRNKDQHIFTSTNANQQIEIRSSEHEEGSVRVYKVGESAKPENCTVSCKRRGRSHFHLIECLGNTECLEKKLGHKAKHSNDIYYYGLDTPSTKKYDQVLCSAYWLLNKWHSPVNDVDRKLIDSCNVYCEKHVERNTNGHILKESIKGFCTLGAWHIGDHVFECQNNHQSLDMYEGIDVCFVIDTTGSMKSYFKKVKQTIQCIIKDNQELLIKLGKTTSSFRFAIIDYRDHPPEGDYVFRTCDFTTDILALQYVTNLKSDSGGDFPEAVLDGLDAACTLSWRENADHLLFHILDAPPHGRIYHTNVSEKWPDGCPCGKVASDVLDKMKKKNIIYHVLRCSNHLNMMITEFKKYIDVKVLTFDDKITFENVITKQVYQRLIDTEMTLKKT
ncbi:unnamed protein product [Adineta steineri]|uniref:VLIG-type G domain-containing protein n=1 Tax=Adineta steineri TaxID=433720 RepID=A0A819PPE2_9BILA|nr:unnamed protein product [Adineta steineri]CAF4017765.1 unnamed protein product [Adineta steineri]